MTNASPAISTMTSALVSWLRSDIVESVFLPGSKLVINDLCERYGVSHILMQEGLSSLWSKTRSRTKPRHTE